MTDKEELVITEEMNQTMIRVWHKFAAILFLIVTFAAGLNLFQFAMLGDNTRMWYFLFDTTVIILLANRIKNDYLQTVIRLALTPGMFFGLFIGVSMQIKTQNSYIILGALAALVLAAITIIILHDATKKK